MVGDILPEILKNYNVELTTLMLKSQYSFNKFDGVDLIWGQK